MRRDNTEPWAFDAGLSAVIDLVDHGILLLDSECALVRTNPAFIALARLGVAPGQLLGASMPAGPATFSHVYADPAGAAGRITAAIGGGRSIIDDRHTLADGKIIAHDYRPVTADGTTVGHLWLLRDVTTGTTGAGTTARRPNHDGAFAAAVAHEVRTPATSIVSFTEMLDDPEITARGRHRATQAVRRNADRMLQLAADLVLLSALECGAEGRAGAGALVDLGTLVRAVAATATGGAPDAPVEVECADGPPVVGDEVLLRRAVAAVVGTVAALASADGPARVRVTASAGPTEWAVTATATARAKTATPTPMNPPDAAPPPSTERLLAARVVDHDDPGTARTGALALLLARAIAVHHGGGLSSASGAESHVISLCVPLTPNPPRL